MAERLGYQLEGRLRNKARTPDGGLRDTLVYSLIPGDPRIQRYENVGKGAYKRMRPRGWLVPRGANPEGVGSLERWLVRSSGESLPMRPRWLVLAALR